MLEKVGTSKKYITGNYIAYLIYNDKSPNFGILGEVGGGKGKIHSLVYRTKKGEIKRVEGPPTFVNVQALSRIPKKDLEFLLGKEAIKLLSKK